MPNLQPLDRGLTWWEGGFGEWVEGKKTRSYEETVCIVMMNHMENHLEILGFNGIYRNLKHWKIRYRL